MKLVRCNGRILQVHDVSDVLYELHAKDVPLKPCGWRIIDDDEEARAQVRELVRSGLYERVV